MKIKEIGEFGLIDLIKKKIPADPSVLIGIGDDAAAVKTAGKKAVLFTTDMLIEGVHFRLPEASAYDIGWKAMAVNVSDIAAMGGLPTHAVVAVGLRADFTARFVDEFYRGLRACARRFGVNIVGGDTNRSEKFVVAVALLGEADKRSLVTRSGARVGDVIFVTGPLGGSYASKKHLTFTPRLKESQFLVNNFHIHSLMDISDGLASDLTRLAGASRVGAILSHAAIPVSKFAENVEQALTEGEDFELLFTLSPKEAARLTLKMSEAKEGRFYPVGKIMPRNFGVRIVGAGGVSKPLAEKGFDHFATGPRPKGTR